MNRNVLKNQSLKKKKDNFFLKKETVQKAVSLNLYFAFFFHTYHINSLIRFLKKANTLIRFSVCYNLNKVFKKLMRKRKK